VIIVAGFLRVAPDARSQYLSECTEVIRAARDAAGCIDFHLSADPIEPGRINIFEQWESVAAVEAFRGSGPPGDQQAAVLDARVTQHEVASSIALT
jgi:quinol monooxygenase YgiN